MATRLANPELTELHQGRSHDSQVQWLRGWRDGGAHIGAEGHRKKATVKASANANASANSNPPVGGPCFVVIHRRGLDWRQWLLSLQQWDDLRNARVRVRVEGESETQTAPARSGKGERASAHSGGGGGGRGGSSCDPRWVEGTITDVVLEKDSATGTLLAAPQARISWDDADGDSGGNGDGGVTFVALPEALRMLVL